jgi:hypothetical protein
MSLSKSYNLKVVHPELAKQWHPVKNGNLTPDQITPGSKKKVWWMCEKGHEWEMRILSRRHGGSCPYCRGHILTKEYNLLALHPELAKQWHPVKNGNLTPDQFTPGSRKKIWWKCEKGHEWRCSISQRSYARSNCPYCAGKLPSEEYNFLALYPEVAKLWHPTKNGELRPEQFIPGASTTVWWRCEKGHEWREKIKRVRDKNCPYCTNRVVHKEYNFQKVHPELAKQWHPLKNKSLKPTDIMPYSNKKIWWLCEKGHVWQASVNQRLAYPGCPFCKRKRPGRDYNLQVINPGLASQWHPTKNFRLKPTEVTPFSQKKVWWLCKKGHEWLAPISVMSRGQNCPYCARKRPSKKYNFLAVHPELAKQWHPTKNGDLTPDQFTPGSKKEVWWKCEKGHEWEMRILSRRHGGSCPYCLGRRISKENNLLAVHPELSKQWHPTKNGGLTPDQVTPGSRKKVWWKCEKDHEWRASIYKRTYGRGCPYCSRKKPSKENNLLVVNPAVASQWHPTKNGNLTPDQVAPTTIKQVWWKCKKGHEWKQSIVLRSQTKGVCLYCSGRKVNDEYNFLKAHSNLAKQWHPTKNGALKPDQVSPNSLKQIWWQCKNGHEWKAAVLDRCKGKGCPYCSGQRKNKKIHLPALQPELAEQWHPTKNENLTPHQVTPLSHREVWWKCEKGHEWRAVIRERAKTGKGCPYCSGKRLSKEYNFLVLHPELAKQWHPEKNGNLTPDQVAPGSRRKVWWKCQKGHEWAARIERRIRGTGCPDCLRTRPSEEYNLKTVHPELASQWHPTKNENLTPAQVTPSSEKQVWWKCEFGHEWKAVIKKRSKGQGCPYCSGRKISYEYF